MVDTLQQYPVSFCLSSAGLRVFECSLGTSLSIFKFWFFCSWAGNVYFELLE